MVLRRVDAAAPWAAEHQPHRKGEYMRDLTKAMGNLDRDKEQWQQSPILPFTDFLQEVIKHPDRMIRNVYQVYSDLIDALVDKGIDEYSDDPESIQFLKYNCSRLFVEGSDRPFFADRLV